MYGSVMDSIDIKQNPDKCCDSIEEKKDVANIALNLNPFSTHLQDCITSH
jgi:hypothetical protein